MYWELQAKALDEGGEFVVVRLRQVPGYSHILADTLPPEVMLRGWSSLRLKPPERFIENCVTGVTVRAAATFWLRQDWLKMHN